ncbi:MAG: hypothetical protein ACLFQB_12200 [Chitinispirillaceae bacterium]
MLKYLLLIPELLFFVCAIEPPNVAGVSETDSGQITGYVVYRDGGYCSGADVIIRDEKMVKKIDVALEKTRQTKSGHDEDLIIDSTKTSPAGIFVFDSVDPGNYLIEVNDHDSLGALVEAQVLFDKPICEIDSIFLQRMGSFTGKVNPDLIEKSGEYRIYIPELNRYYKIDSEGKCEGGSLPPYEYTIHLVAQDSIIESPFDTLSLIVQEDNTTKVTESGIQIGSVSINGKIEER